MLEVKNKKNEMISDFLNKKITILSFIEGESKISLNEKNTTFIDYGLITYIRICKC